MRQFGFLVGLLGLALVVAACGGGAKETSTTPSGGALTVKLSEFKFEPASLSLKNGQKATITVQNTGTTSHNFVIKDLSVNSGLVDPGKSKTVEFTPAKDGSFTLICDVPGHEASGMKATVTVSI